MNPIEYAKIDELNKKLDTIIEQNEIIIKQNEASLMMIQGLFMVLGVNEEDLNTYIEKVENKINNEEVK